MSSDGHFSWLVPSGHQARHHGQLPCLWTSNQPRAQRGSAGCETGCYCRTLSVGDLSWPLSLIQWLCNVMYDIICTYIYIHMHVYVCTYIYIYMIIHICIDRCQICCVLQKKWSPWIIERLEKHMEKLMSNKTDETLWHSHQPNGWTPKWLRGNEQMLKLSQVIVSSFTVIFHLKYTTSTFMSSSRISICQSYIYIYI